MEVCIMDGLPKYYTVLYNAVTNALKELDKQNYGLAAEFLIRGQQDAEEAYLDLTEEEL